MPSIVLNKNVLEKNIGRKIPLEKLKDRISYLGTDLGSVNGNEINVEVFPNRPDMLSEQGFARALSSFMGIKTGMKRYTVNKSGLKMVMKDCAKEWPYAVACIIKGIKFDEEKVREVIQLQEKLGTTLTRKREKGGLGLYPLEKISFPVTFTSRKPENIKFIPLEFKKEMKASEILYLHPKGKEYGKIIDGWRKYPVFIDSKGTIMSMPPIINSDVVGKIDEKTTDVFIEGTGPDLNTIMISLAILATSLADMGGNIYSIEMVYPNRKFDFPNLEPWKMKIDRKYVNKLLGLNLTESEIKKYVEMMGHGYKKGNILIPKYRADILHQIDIVEDIAIAYGYENFDPEISKVSTIGEENPFEVFKNKVAEIMVGMGALETSSFHLTNKKVVNENMLVSKECIELLNAANVGYDVMRSWLIPGLMKILGENTRYDYPQRIFEIGTIFKSGGKNDTGIIESTSIACISCHNNANYTEIRQCAETLLSSFGVNCEVKETEHSSFIDGRVGKIIVNGKDIGIIGEINPHVIDNFGVEQPVCAFELNVSELFNNLK